MISLENLLCMGGINRVLQTELRGGGWEVLAGVMFYWLVKTSGVILTISYILKLKTTLWEC